MIIAITMTSAPMASVCALKDGVAIIAITMKPMPISSIAAVLALPHRARELDQLVAKIVTACQITVPIRRSARHSIHRVQNGRSGPRWRQGPHGSPCRWTTGSPVRRPIASPTRHPATGAALTSTASNGRRRCRSSPSLSILWTEKRASPNGSHS